MRTHPVEKLLEQHCYKSAVGLLQLVRFYVCGAPLHGMSVARGMQPLVSLSYSYAS